MEDTLSTMIRSALADLGLDPTAAFTLEHPGDMAHGDWATNVALTVAKAAGKNPRTLADQIVLYLAEKRDPLLASVEAAGPGFINFRLAEHLFDDVLGEIIADPDSWGMNADRGGQVHLFDYTDPNPFKVFHIGHLMANAIGESLSRLAEFSGARVVRICYGGDVGLHVAKTLWGTLHGAEALPPDSTPLNMRMAYLGAAYVRGAAAYEEDNEAKIEIIALNKKVYAKDASIQEIWHTGKRWSLEHFEEIYKKLGTTFDHQRFESEVLDSGVAQVRRAVGRVFVESDGAIVYKGDPNRGLHTRVFITTDGVPTYETKEVGHTSWKFATYPDTTMSTVVTALEQDDYFKVIYAAIEDLHPEWKGKLACKTHGMMRFASGKMSSRKGNVISGEDLITELETSLRETYGAKGRSDVEDLATRVAVGAIKYAVLKQAVGKDIIFDPDASLSTEGDSGPYLQYTHARIVSVTAKAAAQGVHADPHVFHGDHGDLPRLLARFPEVIRRAEKETAPHLVVNYLIEVAHAFNSWYARVQIVDAHSEAPYKVALAEATMYTLRNGLHVLGISQPKSM